MTVAELIKRLQGYNPELTVKYYEDGGSVTINDTHAWDTHVELY